MRNGLLVRVGIDSTSGGWNAPCSDAGFCYVPMGSSKGLTTEYDPRYKPYENAVSNFLANSADSKVSWPVLLPDIGHFDPDFDYLTYGDRHQRGARIQEVLGDATNSFIVFYAGLRDVDSGELSYSIIGFYDIACIKPASSVLPADWPKNEHTRPDGCKDQSTVIVFAHRGRSGLLRHHIPIGTYRRRAYRVTTKLLKDWGGLDVKDGFIQRSVFLPQFRDSDSFLGWFQDQNPQLIAKNNPQAQNPGQEHHGLP